MKCNLQLQENMCFPAPKVPYSIYNIFVSFQVAISFRQFPLWLAKLLYMTNSLHIVHSISLYPMIFLSSESSGAAEKFNHCFQRCCYSYMFVLFISAQDAKEISLIVQIHYMLKISQELGYSYLCYFANYTTLGLLYKHFWGKLSMFAPNVVFPSSTYTKGNADEIL